MVITAQNTVYYNSLEVTFREANELFSQDNYGSAIVAFEKYMAESENKNSATYEDAAYFATICAINLRYKDASYRISRFIADYPSSAWIPSVKYELANIYFKDNKYSEALDIYKQLSPSKLSREQQYEYYYKTGYCQMKQSEFDRSLASFSRIMNTKNQYSNAATYYYGTIHYQKGNYNEALDAFDKIKNDRKFKKYIPTYILNINYELGNYQQVIDEGQPFLNHAKRKEKSELAQLIANSYYNLENYDKAYEFYVMAEQNGYRSDDPEEEYRIGYCKFAKEEYKSAVNNFQNAIKAGGIVESNAWYYLGYCYLFTDQIKFAQNAFMTAYKSNNNLDISSDALFSYIKISIEHGSKGYNNPVTLVEEYLESDPGSENAARAYNLLSQLYLTSKNYPAAIQSIEKVNRPNKRLQSVYQQLSYAQAIEYFERNALTDAILYFEKSLKYPIDKKLEAEAIFWQGDALYRQKKFTEAKNKFSTFLRSGVARKSDLYPVALYDIAYIEFNTKNYSKAVDYFNRFLQQQPTNTNLINDSYLRLADSYLITKDYNKAISYYDKVIANNHGNTDYALFQKAICYGSQGDFNKKLGTLNVLTTKYRSSLYYDDALYDIASTNIILNDPKNAIVYFDKLIKEKPKSTYAKKAMVKTGMLYYNNGQYNQAANSLKKVIDTYPASLEAKEALITLRSVYVDMGQVDDYIEFAKDLDFVQISTSEEDSLNFVTGENYFLDNDCSKAIPALKKYIEQFPSGGMVLSAYHYLTICHEKINDPDGAISFYEKIIEYPENQYTDKALITAARYYYDKNEYSKSLQYYEKLSELADNKLMLLESYDGIMKSAWNTGNTNKAKEAAKELLMTENVAQDQIVYAHYLLGKIAMSENKSAEAEKEFNITTKLSKTELGAEALYNLAYLKYKDNKLEDAETIIYELPEKYPNYDYWIANGFILLADVYVGRDNIFQAEQTLNSVIDNYKGDDLREVARKKLENTKAWQEQKNNEINNDNQ